ncbi:MAG: DUF1858 domain-containing protein [Armatimonadota bacterium]
MISKKPITKDTRISDIIKVCPSAPEVLNRHGMGCFACMAASAETIEEGAQMHEVDVQAVLDELNAVCLSPDCED